MGRDFRNMRVVDKATLLLKTRGGAAPAWLPVLRAIPRAEALVRLPPIQHNAVKLPKKGRKPSKMFMPQNLMYQEDKLRRDFFADHPWELARPRTLVEEDGKDALRWDWGQEHQIGRPMNGESVVQRQHYLMTVGIAATDPQTGKTVHHPLSKAAAYDKARKELYERRHQDEMERLIQREEACAVDAQFGMGANEVGMHLEGKEFDGWKEWARQQATIMEQARSAAYGGTPAAPSTEGAAEEAPSEGENLLNVLGSFEKQPAQKES